ncbi:MAG: helix-turn-helix domain-containing protein [Pseudomonadales bacterium]
MDSLLFLAIGAAASQLILMLLQLYRQWQGTIQQQLYVLLMLAVMGYLLAPLTGGSWLTLLTSPLQTAVPGLFWLFSASLFDDNFVLRRWKIALVALTIALPELDRFLGYVGVNGSDALLLWLPQALEFVLLALALSEVARYWQVDLVQSRRRLRLWFAAVVGLYLFFLIFLRELVFDGSAGFAVVQYASAAILLLLINHLLLRVSAGLLFEEGRLTITSTPAVVPEECSEDPVLDKTLESLTVLMEQGYYREMSLTIGKLAQELALPEYKLRQLINSQLGYRNFNDYLNRYRIEEAAVRLRDPAQRQLPILTIAMDCGFRSLSSFNKSFRDTHTMTPTAWRKSLD